MGNSLYLDRAERPRLEFGLLRLNFTNLTYINNNTFSVNKTTETFTGHGLIVWKGSFFTLLEDVFQSAEDNLDSLAHPLFHYATIIEENEDRVFITPAEKTKLAGLAAGANNYVHPTTHSLSMITETTDRKSFTPTERTKLNGIEQGANNYIHPDSHPVSDIDGLLDINGHLTPTTPSYLYSNRRHFISKELSLSFGETEYIVDDCKGIDAVNYIGTGSLLSIPFHSGFHLSDSTLLMFFPTYFNSLVLYNSKNKNIFMNKNQSSGIFGTLLNMEGIETNPLDIKLKISSQYINRLNTLYAIYGMKFSEVYKLGTPSFNLYADTYGIFNQLSFEEREYDSNLSFRLFYNIFNTSFYVSRVVPDSNPSLFHYCFRRSRDGVLQQYMDGYHMNHYLYSSDKVPNDYHTLLFVQYDSTSDGIKFRLFYKRNHQTVTDVYFIAFKSSSTVYKHSNNEVVTDISIAPIIVHADPSVGKTQQAHAVSDDYFLCITSNNGSSSWLTIYRLKISTKEISLHQTLNFSYIVNKVAFNCLKLKSYFSTTYFYSNYLTFWANDKLYVYAKRIDILNVSFTSVHTIDMVLPAEITNTSIKSCIWYNGTITMPGHIILQTDNYIFIYLLLMNTPMSGSVFFWTTLSTLSSMAYTDKYLSDGKTYNTIPIKSDWMRVLDNRMNFNVSPYEEQEKPLVLITENSYGTKVSLFFPLKNQLYQNIFLDSNSGQTIPRSTVGIDYYENLDGLPNLYIGQGENFITYKYDLMTVNKNPYMKTAMWDYRIGDYDPINNYSHFMNSLPIIVFCYVYDSSSNLSKKKLIAIYNKKQYFVEELDQPPTSNQDGFYGNFQPLKVDDTVSSHTNTILRYNSGAFDTISYDCLNGNSLMYFGFFGDIYEANKNGSIVSVKGTPGVTCFVEMSPGDVIDVGFKPNVIKILPLETPPIVLTGYSMLMLMRDDNFSKIYSYIATNYDTPYEEFFPIDNTLITVDDENITLNPSSLGSCLIIALGASIHTESSDFSIQASPINPLFMSMMDAPNNLGEKDNVTIKTTNIIPITPTDLNQTDSRYLVLNTFGDIVYNNTDGVYPGEWEKPDEVLYYDVQCTKPRTSGPYRYLPLAKVNFVDDSITEVISYPQSDLYVVNWFDYFIGTPVVLDNKFMSLGIMVKVLLKNEDGVIFNNDGLSNNGVKVSFDHEFITISSFPGQTYVLDTDTSCRLKIIIKRLF